MPRRNGFTLIELMIVVVIVGILAVLAIPNFVSMQSRAREAAVKSNAHTVQLAAEDFSAQNDGVYATDDTTLLPNGDSLSDLVPVDLVNPFDPPDAAPVIWNGIADAEGRIGYDTAAGPGSRYVIDGQGRNGMLVLQISNGI
jgi:prepilin-type N-terminal cleavage/methylation domain-containing protein